MDDCAREERRALHLLREFRLLPVRERRERSRSGILRLTTQAERGELTAEIRRHAPEESSQRTIDEQRHARRFLRDVRIVRGVRDLRENESRPPNLR
jgi:hypothetical protein